MSDYNVNRSLVKWKVKQVNLHKSIVNLSELINIRDGAQRCIRLTHN